MDIKYISLFAAKYSEIPTKEVMIAAINTIIQAVEAKDSYTKHHSQKVAEYARIIALEMDLPQEQVEQIYLAALFHDIGKIGVPDQILRKPDKLTEEEMTLLKQHPLIACRILEGFESFRELLPAIAQHHEYWNGSGYPYGLVGETIDLGARILAVADAFDAMTSDRVYRPGMSQEQAIGILIQEAGKQWDPQVVNCFVNWWEKTFNPEGHHDWQYKHIVALYKNFLEDVTNGKVKLISDEEIKHHELDYTYFTKVFIQSVFDISQARQMFSNWLTKILVPPHKQRIYSVVFSELITNVVKHAGRGHVQWGLDNSYNIIITIRDEGKGFVLEKLPQSILINGFSTRNSLGRGLPLVFNQCEQLLISYTGKGTFISVKLACEKIAEKEF
ncbi:HD domain-containing phosphohydrolase [Carboxydocella sp. JDF658]|uniref:HD domain-containing phosphohydrolase n=1 Tax=Carboxydocella sp. JDF658 TaxID=1926600 RepID=UPI0009AC1B6B|nr:HD domain-containing phosphohydrolase [Carboxydocella sp. JDF658]GAW32347.1 metal-dependent phosphohydrolase [Carboxydocella sp. JDF658]